MDSADTGRPAGGVEGRRGASSGATWWLVAAVILAVASGPSRSIGQAPAGEMTPESAPAPDEQELGDIDLLTLEVPTVVTASRRREKVSGVPYAISVITAEDIRAAGAQSVPDALRLVPGVDVSLLSYNTAAVGIRGNHGLLTRNLLVLVDGRQIFDSIFGGTLWGGWPFLLEDIKRIEVIRGPGGVTWGANADGGVINIITRDPGEQQGLTLSGMGGSRGSSRQYAGVGFRDEKLRARVSGQYRGSDGFLKGGSFLRPLDDYVDQGSFNAHAVYEAGRDDTLTLSAGHALTYGGLPAAPLASFLTTQEATAYGTFLLGRWEHRIEDDNTLTLTGYFNDYYECPAAKAIDYRYDQFALQVGHTFKPAEDHTLTWGIDTRADILDAHYADPGMLTEDYLGTGIVGAYVQDDWVFADRWKLSLGGRIDYEFYEGFQPSARAALAYEPADDMLIWAAVSRAFQVPPAGSRFLQTPLADGLAYITSDRRVSSEILTACEVGWRGRFHERLQAGAVVYCHHTEDRTILRMLPGPPGLLRYNFENGYDVTDYGVELDATYAVSERFTLLGHYTFKKSEAHGPWSPLDSDSMVVPEHRFMVGARYRPIDPLTLSADLYYTARAVGPNPTIPLLPVRIPPYCSLNLRAEYELWKDRAWVAVGVRDLLDSHHLEGTTQFENLAEVPRMVYGEVRMRLP